MRWSSDATKTKSNLFLLIALLAASTVPVLPAPHAWALQSGGSGIEVRLCPQPGEASLTVNEPPDGTRLQDDRIVIKGGASRLAEIEFYVEEVYRTTLEMGDTAVGYEQPLTLSPGAQTVKVVGYDVCRQVVGTKTVSVIVPQSAAQPEPPAGQGSVPVARTLTPAQIAVELPVVYRTKDPGQKTAANNSGAKTDGRPPGKNQPPATNFSAGPDGSLLKTIFTSLDLEATLSNPANIARAITAVAAIGLIILPAAATGPLLLLINMLNSGYIRIFGSLLPFQVLRQGARKGRAKNKPKSAPALRRFLVRHRRALVRSTGVLLLVALFII